MNADGSAQENLTQQPASDSHPSWSPDGRKLVFVSRRDGNAEIYVMNADGSGLRNLTRTPSDDLDPAWSPDGRAIAFVQKKCMPSRTRGDRCETYLYVVNADGSGLRRLTTDRGHASLQAGRRTGRPSGTGAISCTPTAAGAAELPIGTSRSTECGRPTGSGSPPRGGP